MMDALNAIQEFAADGKQAFLEDRRTRDAVLRNLEVLGEAVKGLSAEFRAEYEDVPWRRIAGMRDKLIHDYGRVDVEAVWSVVVNHLPPLRKALEAAVASGL